MKKTLLSLLSILSVAVSAQQLTYANQAPAWGNIPYTTSQCDSTGVGPGPDGLGVVWSFTPTAMNSTKTYSTSNTLPGVASYSASNVSVYASASDISYYYTDVNSYKYYGGNITINTFNISLTFNTPTIYANYPMNVLSSATSSPSGSITINGSISGTFVGTATTTASGSGTLNLPGKSFNDVIKVTTAQKLNASLSLGTGTVTMVTYDYYSTGTSKAPLFSIQTSTIVSLAGTSTQTTAIVQNNFSVVGVKENQKSIDLLVFPNPATSLVNFNTTYTEAAKVIAYDVTGKIVATEALEMGKGKMNTSGLTNGIYLYSILGKDNQVLKTGKFNVTK